MCYLRPFVVINSKTDSVSSVIHSGSVWQRLNMSEHALPCFKLKNRTFIKLLLHRNAVYLDIRLSEKCERSKLTLDPAIFTSLLLWQRVTVLSLRGETGSQRRSCSAVTVVPLEILTRFTFQLRLVSRCKRRYICLIKDTWPAYSDHKVFLGILSLRRVRTVKYDIKM